LILALLFSIGAGLAIPLFIGFPAALFLLILAGGAACAIGKTGRTATTQSLFQHLQPVPDDPLLEKVRARWRQAEETAQQLDEQYDREGGNSRWVARRKELLSQMDTYENLEQLKQQRLQELEAEARKIQLEEFLDRFEIDDAEIKDISPAIKTHLLSH